MDPADARAQLNQALSLAPDLAPAQLGRGVVTLFEGDAAALSRLEFAAGRYPKMLPFSILDEAYTALDRSAEAMKVLRRASELLAAMRGS